MKRSLITATAFIVFFLSHALAAQQASDPNDLRKLEGYLRHAALNNAGLRAAFEQWRASVDQVPQAKALDDPKFTYGYFIEEVETRVGPQRQKFGLMQQFPWFGTIEARTDAAAAAAKAAHKRYEAAKLKLFHEVKDGFYEYAYLGRAIETAEQNLGLLEHFEEVVRTRYTAAVGSHPDIIRAQIELAILQDKLESLAEMRQPIVGRLNSVLNRESELSLPWPEREVPAIKALDRKALVAKLVVNNPQLQALSYEIVAARAGVELARKRSKPNVNLGVDWIQTDEARGDGVWGSGRDPIMAMFSVNIPIWTGSNKAAERQAASRVQSVVAQRVQKQNDIVAAFEKTLYEHDDAARKMTLYADILIPKAKEMLEASEVAYRGGTIDFLSLIDAQQTLLKFELLYERSVTDNLTKQAALEMLVGSELD